MKRFTKICLIITVTLFVIGVASAVTGYMVGYARGELDEIHYSDSTLWINRMFGYSYNAGSVTTQTEQETAVSSSMEISEDYETDSSSYNEYYNINDLDIQVQAGSIYFEETTNDYVAVESYGINSLFSCYQKDDKLVIKDERLFTDDARVTIYYPQGYTFDEVKLQLGAGEGWVNSFKADKISIEIGAGSLYCYETIADKIELTVGAGSLDVQGIAASKLKLSCGAGDAYLTGDIYDELDIENGVGDVEVQLNGDGWQSYDYNLNVGLGGISVNENEYTTLDGSVKIDNGAGREIKASSGIGMINIQIY